eukprot:TRINITY_DN623_c0_g1_i1.p1 TRINITY_DN623_c0_g1~~TRINITY_DN623_c0_g1_i1.p1  ORF type:complete len:148 (-),score=18.47 TRINITY_DN623_c0_g1_i1:146-589(-)
MMNNNRYWLFLCACLLIGLVQVTTKSGISQWKLEQAQRYAEQRFLGYIAEARRTLKRFYYLPYLVTNDETSVRFIDGEARLEKRIKKQLIQLDKAANTKGWYLLSGEGDLLVSSVERSKLSKKNASTIVSKIHQQGGAISVVTKNKA